MQELNEVQKLLQKKQTFINRGMQNLQQGNTDKSKFFFNLDSGLNIEIENILNNRPSSVQDVKYAPVSDLYEEHY